MAEFATIITNILRREGGARLTNTTGDRGGLTKYGIAQQSHPDLDIEHLTEEQARAIYRRDYWDPIKGDAITSQPVAEAIMDTAVNQGVGTAIRLAQQVVGATVDGVLGPKTLTTINQMVPGLFTARYAVARIRRYAELCTTHPEQRAFLLGWINRVLECA